MNILIDRNKLIECMKEKSFSRAAFHLVMRQPEIEAIPVKWIEKWQNSHEWEYESFFKMKEGIPKYAIEYMLEDWEKENGREVK